MLGPVFLAVMEESSLPLRSSEPGQMALLGEVSVPREVAGEDFAGCFRLKLRGREAMPFAEFMEMALYAPGVGYYTRPTGRVGRSGERDFYTAASLGPVFGELVVASLVGEAERAFPGVPVEAFTLVELGAEPGVEPFSGVTLPFGGYQRVGFGEAMTLPPRAVVVANELLDAQPCVRLVFYGGRWRELGVAMGPGGGPSAGLVEVMLPEPSNDAQAVIERLPKLAPEGYHFDYAWQAEVLLASLVQQPWEGVWLCLDYGKTWEELAGAVPQGTARGYYRHRQVTDLLARPGEQDLTSDVAWDRLAEVLRGHRFRVAEVQSQEAFFVHRASRVLQRLIESGTAVQRSHVRSLLHPAHFGSRFQVQLGTRVGVPG